MNIFYKKYHTQEGHLSRPWYVHSLFLCMTHSSFCFTNMLEYYYSRGLLITAGLVPWLSDWLLHLVSRDQFQQGNKKKLAYEQLFQF